MANSIEWERKSVGKTTRKKQESSANQALILSRTIVKPFFTSLHYAPERGLRLAVLNTVACPKWLTSFLLLRVYHFRTSFKQLLGAHCLLCGGSEDQK